MAAQFNTIGHSGRSLEEFLDMLRAARIDLLVDVRAFPRSRSNPAFKIDRLPDDLSRIQIGYHHAPALGGRPSAPGSSRVIPRAPGAGVPPMSRSWRIWVAAEMRAGAAYAHANKTLVGLDEIDGR